MTTLDQPAAPTVAMLGLGAMGLPMATRLAGLFPVRGYDPTPGQRRRATGAGVVAVGSAREAVFHLSLVAHGEDDHLCAVGPCPVAPPGPRPVTC